MKKIITILLLITLTIFSLETFVGCGVERKLEYELERDEQSYIVTGFMEDVEEYPDKIVIPEKHKGKPVTKIGSGAFRGRTEITSVTLPESVTSISSYAFKGCENLMEINIPQGVKVMGMGAFDGCKKLTSITIPEGVVSITESLFNGCESLTEITIPEGVKKIRTKAFSETGIKKIELPASVKEIDARAFRNATSLEEFVLGDGVEIIDAYVFDNCSSLKKVTLGAGLRGINNYAFNECFMLEEIIIPSTVRAIHGYAFYGCNKLRRMVFEGTEGTMIKCNRSECGATICPESKRLGFTTHYHSTFWYNSELSNPAYMHNHWIYSHDLSNPDEAWKYFVKDEEGNIMAGVLHNHALGAQGDYWSFKDGKYLFKGKPTLGDTDVDADIRGWKWMDVSEIYMWTGEKGEY